MPHTPGPMNPPKFNETNVRRVDPMACSCYYDDESSAIAYCPLHAAAPEMRALLSRTMGYANVLDESIVREARAPAGAARGVAMLALIEESEAALSKLSNALQDALYEEQGDKSNLHWADAAVDRAMRDLETMRRWLEG